MRHAHARAREHLRTPPRPTRLRAGGSLEAHACAALADGAELRGASRAARGLTTPLLAVCAGGGALEAADELRSALSTSRLGRDYFVAGMDAPSCDVLLYPPDGEGLQEAERIIALVQSWVDRYVPERLGKSAK